jgi:hypothetical protein
MNKIYADSDVCRWHLTQINLEISEEITADSPAVFHMPFPYSADFELKIQRTVAVCPMVIILVSELHADSTRFIVNNQHPRIKYFVCGLVEGYPAGLWMDWFVTTCGFYKDTDILKKLDPYKVKSKYFDLLLGWRKPHRDIIYNYINENNLIDKVTMTYLTDRSIPINQQGIWEVAMPANTFNTITQIQHLGSSASLSQIIPLNVYNQTAYTVVAETNYDNHYSFYTEKIVKPIHAKRLIIVFAGHNYLKNLISLGFKIWISVCKYGEQLIISLLSYLPNLGHLLT